MRCFLFAILLLAAPRGTFALMWDFADGSTWGWIAQEGSYTTGSRESLHSEIVDGVWRIAPVPGRRPTVELRSPLIGKDSALFDRLTLRLRLAHHNPAEEPLPFLMSWSNAESRRLLKGGGSTGRNLHYPVEWEEITIDLPPDPAWGVAWQDTLFNIRIDMLLYRDSQDVANHPKFLEIDYIQLTGAEELAQGELSPRDISVEVGPPGALFAAPGFFPLGEGIGISEFSIRSSRASLQESHGVMGDVDDDGDADLVAVWRRLMDREIQRGWTVASNDGLGNFEPIQEDTLSTSSLRDPTPDLDLRGSDFDGDGLLDLVVVEDWTIELWYGWGDGFDHAATVPGFWLVGLADGDGDGTVDLLVGDGPQVTLWINDGYDFVISDTFTLDSEETLFAYLPAGQPLGQAASLWWNRPCDPPYERTRQPPRPYQLTRPWAGIQEPPLVVEAEVNPCALHLVADLDGNGTVDLLGSPERIYTFFDTDYYGLALWRLDASGVLARHSLLDWQALLHGATASDLNGDGVLDVALVIGNSTVGKALVVWLGQRNGAPALEGSYPLPGDGIQVLASDVNGDGDTDLVVLGTSPASDHGGVFVFINQGTPATAVASEAATPTAFTLGTNYPNPFNPATTIPLAVPAGAKNVDLTIYNVLGQPLRQVWTGPLPAGEHRLTWDGHDAQGQPVAAGVYVYRLQVDEQTRTRKMVKIE